MSLILSILPAGVCSDSLGVVRACYPLHLTCHYLLDTPKPNLAHLKKADSSTGPKSAGGAQGNLRVLEMGRERVLLVSAVAGLQAASHHLQGARDAVGCKGHWRTT